MIAFIKKVIIFLLPLSLIFAFPIFVIYNSREFFSSQDIIAQQAHFPDALFGFLYTSDLDLAYKKKLIDMKHPQVLAVGTSKVMEIRKEFFLSPEMFANAGVPIGDTSIGDMENLIEHLEGSSTPKLIFLGVDQDLLYADYRKEDIKRDPPFVERISALAINTSRNVYLDFFAHKYDVLELSRQHQINPSMGIGALLHGDGYRSDGSYRYHKAEQNAALEEEVSAKISARVQEIKTTPIPITEYRKEQLRLNLVSLSRILQLCKDKGITVVGFTPPYPKPVYETMLSSSGLENNMVARAPQEVSSLFAAYHDPFFDFSSVDNFGGGQDVFIDVLHGTDVMYVHMMLAMASQTHVLDAYLDISALKSMLQAKQKFLPF
jgi:hypothetical protein